MSSSIVCSDLSFDWPDGTSVFDHLNTTFEQGRTGLIGLNGSGKSTLLRLITGELVPCGGTVDLVGDTGYLPQDVALDVDRSVSDLLGITSTRTALSAIENGSTCESDFALVGADWDVEERARAQLRRFGILTDTEVDVLDRPIGTLSGGEVVLTGLAGLALRRPAITLLDEPTNNLDDQARSRLYAAVEAWHGVLLVVSHDRELLERVDRIAECREDGIRTYGGNFSAYTAQLTTEQEAARRRVRAAEADLRREKRQWIESHTKLARRERYAATDHANKRRPKVVMNLRRDEAQVSAGKHRIMQAEKLEEAKDGLTEAEDAVRADDRIRVDLPKTAVPSGRTLLELEHPEGTLSLRGPERVAVLGPNGSGKTTLLRTITGHVEHPSFTVTRSVGRLAYLPQRLNILDDELSVLDNVRSAAPSATPNEIRAGLARFLFRGEHVDQPAGALSGGERFRASLACLLLAEVPPQLVVLDEPTNNLDLDSVDQLTHALSGYRGALLVSSHDRTFLREVGITRWWSVENGRILATEHEPGGH